MTVISLCLWVAYWLVVVTNCDFHSGYEWLFRLVGVTVAEFHSACDRVVHWSCGSKWNCEFHSVLKSLDLWLWISLCVRKDHLTCVCRLGVRDSLDWLLELWMKILLWLSRWTVCLWQWLKLWISLCVLVDHSTCGSHCSGSGELVNKNNREYNLHHFSFCFQHQQISD